MENLDLLGESVTGKKRRKKSKSRAFAMRAKKNTNFADFPLKSRKILNWGSFKFEMEKYSL